MTPPLEWAWLGTVAYRDAWDLQRRLAEQRRAGALTADCVLLLEHPPVYTLGRGTEAEHVPGGAAALRARGAEVHEVDRGGSVTFHGPGQLVAYPIVLLAEAFPIAGVPGHGDVDRYLRALEQALLDTVEECGVACGRRPPYTGAWVDTRKIAAIGVKLARGVTQHGVALNVSTDLDWFAAIVPCGIRDGGVTSLRALGVDGHTPESLASRLALHLAEALGRTAVPSAGWPDRTPTPHPLAVGA